MRRRIPSLISLECFESAARHLSFTQAGVELCLTQSAVSRQIKNLEQFLGMQLFVRSKQGVTLSAEGASYAVALKPLLDQLEATTADAASGCVRPLLLAAEPALVSRWLLPRMGQGRDKGGVPPVEFELDTDMGRIYGAARDYDLAILFGSGNWPGLECQLLMAETLLAVCSPDLLVKNGGEPLVKREGIAQMPLLHQTGELSSSHLWLQHAGISAAQIGQLPGPRLEYFQLLLEAALQGLGVAIMPWYFVRDELADGRLVRACEQDLQCDQAYYLAVPEGKSGRQSIQQLRQWLTAPV
ncbi:LysR substrate-binding domain-containing protein [Porticoccus sp. W117]|uniref:LysR substrate-binding domain-containing protein n=1 Tax=Porticoccus sp. W117 TaxID=3054777 RepID=UPI002595A200|nr:LysR substrate-binding domain-containing protein [Porticoccus sp. W117]MDM3869795.1 LysR substrate-binding domain-containing protein [Porticoccus sp. W117]